MNESTSVERWIPVVGFEGIYEVSDLGQVRSVDRVVHDMFRGQVRTRWFRGVPLRQSRGSGGYYQVCMSRDGVQGTQMVHRVVARAFHGEPSPGQVARHGANGMTDNSVGNVTWGTQSQNIGDTVRDGTNWWAQVERCPRGHRLVAPNLVAAQRKRGHRSCLACARGHSAVRNAWLRRGVELDLATEANRHHRLLMS